MFWWLTYVYSTGSIVDFKNGQQVWCHLCERSGTRTRPLLRQSYGHGVKSSEERPDEEPSLLPYTARGLCSKVAEWSTVKWPLWFQRRFYFHQCGIDWGMENKYYMLYKNKDQILNVCVCIPLFWLLLCW